MANLQNYLTSNLVTKINAELVYNDFFTPLSVGLASGSDAFTGETFDATPQGGATKDSAIIAIDGGTSPDYFNIDSTAANGTGFDIDFRRPVTSSITITEDNISEYDPDATFTIVNPDNLFDGDFGTDCNFSTATIGETMGFEIDLGDGEYVDNLEIALKNTGVGDLTNELFNISYSINGTDFIVDAFTILGTQLDITGNTFNLFNLEYNENYRRGYSNTLDGGWTQKGKIPKIKKLRVYIDSCTSSLSFDITQLRVNKVEFEEPDGIYLNTINIKYVHGSGLSDTISYQVAYDDEEVFYELGENTHSGFGVTTFNVNSIDRKVKKFRISYPTDGTPGSDLRIYEIVNLTYYPDPPTLLNFEFNDSVLETKAWNSSRYDGKQLAGAVINEFRAGDTTYGKTPVLRNYTRNIYIGNEIVGMAETSPEDPTLVQFPNFSYAQINSYITINADLSITRNEFDPSDINNSKKKAFYRPFIYDLAEGSFCNFIMGDLTVKNNLKSKYPIYFNGGQLKKLLQLKTHLGAHAQSLAISPQGNGGAVFTNTMVSTPENLITGSVYHKADLSDVPVKIPNSPPAIYFGCTANYADAFDASRYVTSSAMSASLHNEEIYTNWFTGSLVSFLNVGFLGPVLDFGEVRKFSDGLISYKNDSSYKGDKRFFITCAPYMEDKFFPEGNTVTGDPIEAGNPKPLYTFEKNSIHSGSAGVITPNLSSLTTLEVAELNTYRGSINNGQTFIYEYRMNQKSTSYIDMHSNMRSPDRTVGLRFGKSSVPNFESGSFIFSISDDDTPSILVPLKKDRDLPNGKGDKPFIIIPENLHPFIKDNLTYFLTRAGIDIGGNTSTLIPLDQTNRYPDRIGWKPPKPAPTPELEAAQEAKAELTFEQRRLLARQLAEQNRRRRLERLREEEENSRRNKRRSRRKGRQEDREERKALREERKEKRRENRQENRNERRENRQNRRENRRNRRRNR